MTLKYINKIYQIIKTVIFQKIKRLAHHMYEGKCQCNSFPLWPLS